MRFLIIGDLHGNKPNIHFTEFDAIVAPGDFCSDAVRKYAFKAQREGTIWYKLIGKRKARKFINKSLSDGRKVLEYLNSFGVPVYVVPGNWDWTQRDDPDWPFLKHNHYKSIIDRLSNIIDVHFKLKDAGEYQIIGYGVSSGPEFPQYKEELEGLKPGELSDLKKKYESKLARLVKLFEKSKKTSKPTIFLSHNVPLNTRLDKITNKESSKYNYHYGSLIARDIIEEYQPLVCIGGHMHEHFGKCKIGRTTVINAGYGSDVNVLMELSQNRIKYLKFYNKK